MPEIFEEPINPLEKKIAIDTLERYSGSDSGLFQPFLLLTNFPSYVEAFAKERGLPVFEGAMFKTAHSPKEKISILDFKIGSPAAALVIDLCAFLPFKGALLLGMCGGLRRKYQVGDFFLPIASIRGEATSDFYFPKEVPALANFIIQKVATTVLEDQKIPYHIGITYTTNKRFWEFNENFKETLKETRPQAIEMECATLFMASYKQKLPLGALLLISDLPLAPNGIKTKKSSKEVFLKHTGSHLEKGVAILKSLEKELSHKVKGLSRGSLKKK